MKFGSAFAVIAAALTALTIIITLEGTDAMEVFNEAPTSGYADEVPAEEEIVVEEDDDDFLSVDGVHLLDTKGQTVRFRESLYEELNIMCYKGKISMKSNEITSHVTCLNCRVTTNQTYAISRLQRRRALVLVLVNTAAADRHGRLRDLCRQERHRRAPYARGPQGDVAVGPAAVEDQGRQAEPLRAELRRSPHQGEVLGHPPHVPDQLLVKLL